MTTWNFCSNSFPQPLFTCPIHFSRLILNTVLSSFNPHLATFSLDIPSLYVVPAIYLNIFQSQLAKIFPSFIKTNVLQKNFNNDFLHASDKIFLFFSGVLLSISCPAITHFFNVLARMILVLYPLYPSQYYNKTFHTKQKRIYKWITPPKKAQTLPALPSSSTTKKNI